MQLRECDVSLQKVRVYRDCAEVLLCAYPSAIGPKRPPEASIKAWRISLGQLSEEEQNSLRVLSPQQTMLHLEWVDEESLQKPKRTGEVTAPVKPLSLPPPKLKDLKRDLPKAQDGRWSISEEQRELTYESIRGELERWATLSPTSVEAIKRRLAVTDTLTQLQERWQQCDLTACFLCGQASTTKKTQTKRKIRKAAMRRRSR